MGECRAGNHCSQYWRGACTYTQQYTNFDLDKNECYGYGGNSYGQLGQQSDHISKPTPLHALKDMKVMAVYCGAYHSFIQNAKGQLYAFGFNLKGQLGLGSY